MADERASGVLLPTPAAVVTLRPFNTSDLDAVTEWLMDDRVGRNMRWSTCKTRDEARSFFENTILPHPWCRAICVDGDNDGGKGDRKPVGFIYATPLEGGDTSRARMGCSISAGHWGRGIGAVALRMATEELFRTWQELETLEAQTDLTNLRSQRVLRKAGFRAEAVLRKVPDGKGNLRDKVFFTLTRPRSKL